MALQQTRPEDHSDPALTLTPFGLASAIGVSESSVKRWCDAGRIPAFRTMGGHRRIAKRDAIAFIRKSGAKIVAPEPLGIYGDCPRVSTETTVDRVALWRELLSALLDNDEVRVRRLTVGAFMSTASLGILVDDVIAPAFRRIGDCWETGAVSIHQERRACEIMAAVIVELTRFLPMRDAGPRAIGATFVGDHYTLPGRLVELLLRDGGWNAMMLGNGLPASIMVEAMDELRPDLLWISCSHFEDIEVFRSEFNRLARACWERQIPLIAGGRALTSSVRCRLEFACFCDTLQHLEKLAGRIADRGPNQQDEPQPFRQNTTVYPKDQK